MEDVGLRESNSVVVAFIFYWVACEKLAKVIVAIKREQSTIGSDFQSRKWFRTSDLVDGHDLLGLKRVISRHDLDFIFLKVGNRFAAAALRDRLFHDCGSTHVTEVTQAAVKLNPLMSKFLSCRQMVIDYIERRAREQSRPPP